jgi:hypothetical protein
MAEQRGPLEICCDTPPDWVIVACEKMRFDSPLDVGWRQLGHQSRENGLLTRIWRWLMGAVEPTEGDCICGGRLPALTPYAFSSRAESQVDYLLGQCPRCRTIYWQPLRASVRQNTIKLV